MVLLKSLFEAKYNLASEKFTEGLNSISLVFYDNNQVCDNVKRLIDLASQSNKDKSLMDSCIVDLFKSMLIDLNIKNAMLNDTYLLRTFNVIDQTQKNK